MIRAMFSAISGLRTHQTMMDVVGNNISNVNTTGFKTSNTVFSEVLNQTVRGAGAVDALNGGSNPIQIGLGVRLAGITTSFAQGALQRTQRSTDFAIQGDGFFITQSPSGRQYTRSGSFAVDSLGRLVTQEGNFVNGWQANNGQVVTSGPVGQITIPVGDTIPPIRTSVVKMTGNLPSDAAVGTNIVNSLDVYDGQGKPTSLRIEYTKTAANTWGVGVRYTDPTTGSLVPATTGAAQATTGGPLVFDASGECTSGYNLTVPAGFMPDFPTQAVTLNYGAAGSPNRVTQYGKISNVTILDQDGQSAGSLQSFSTSEAGLIVGSYTNGRTRTIGQLAMATFANPDGLEKASGSTAFRESVNSGLPQIGLPGIGGRGVVAGGALEQSNVDLAQEFTNLIVAQRGFQANSRVVTTADEMLQDVVNLKR